MPLLFVLLLCLLCLIRPVWGYYVFLAASVVIDLYLWRFEPWSSELTPYFYGLWRDIGFTFFSLENWINTIDAVLVSLTLGAAFRDHSVSHSNSAKLPRSLLLLPALFVAAVAAMVLYGVYTGGDTEIAVWQARPYVYFVWVALLTALIIRTRNELICSVGILVGGAALKATQIIWIFITDAKGEFGEWREILGHEDSLFIVAALSLIAGLAIMRERSKFVIPALVLAVLLVFGLILNLRRAGYAALALVMLLGAAIFWRYGKRIVGIIGPLLLCAGVYSAMFWNSDAPVALPLQKVKSVLLPSQGTTDAASNLYRVTETANLLSTIRSHPWGLGFGHPFEMPLELPDVSEIVPNWQYFPHNTFLGLWAFLGPVGLGAFLLYLSALLFRAGQNLQNEDLFLRSAAFFAAAGLSSALVIGTVDQFVWAQRGAIFLGALAGVVLVVDRLRRSERQLS